MKNAPCESCPPDCSQCAWEVNGERIEQSQTFTVVRDNESYGCVFGGEIVINDQTRKPGIRRGDQFHSLSKEFGHVIDGTRFERDIHMMR